MEAVMIAGIAVAVVGAWYSVIDLLVDMGIKIGKRSSISDKRICIPRSSAVSSQRGVKQMAGVNI